MQLCPHKHSKNQSSPLEGGVRSAGRRALPFMYMYACITYM